MMELTKGMYLDSQVTVAVRLLYTLQGQTPVASSRVVTLSSAPLLQAEEIWVPHEFGEGWA